MKSLFLTILLTLIFSNTFSQTNVEKLKKDLATTQSANQKLKDENEYLKEKLNYYVAITSDTTTEIKSFSSSYTIKVISCKGDRNSQTVTIDLILEHKTSNQSLGFNLKDSKAVSSIGQEFKLNNPGISTNYYSIFSNTPQRLTIVVNSVLPGTDSFSLVALKMASHDMNTTNYQYDFTEIRNLKIEW